MMSGQENFILAGTPDADALAVVEKLEGALAKSHKVQAFEISKQNEINAALSEDPNATLCIIYSAAENALSSILQNGDKTSDLLAQWEENAQAILALQRQNRARSLIFEANHFAHYFTTGLSRLGASVEGVSNGQSPHGMQQRDPILALIARHFVLEHQKTADLRNELEASTQVLSNDGLLSPSLPL